MTLCLAAHAYDWRPCKQHVIFAFDFELEGLTSRAAIAKKVMFIGPRDFPVMIAGTTTRAVDLVNTIDTVLHEHEESNTVPPKTHKELLRIAVLKQKYKIASDIVAGALGITYEDFLNKGKSTLPDDVYREMVYDISRTTLDCSLLVIAYDEFTPSIYRINESGLVETCDHFAAIGSGSYVAESSLFHRAHDARKNLGEALYNVYEAMKLGAHAPGVSDIFQVGIAEWWYWDERRAKDATTDGMVQIHWLSDKYHKYLGTLFKRYGPRPVGKILLHKRWINDADYEVTQRGAYFKHSAKAGEKSKHRS